MHVWPCPFGQGARPRPTRGAASIGCTGSSGKNENIVIASRPLEATAFQVENIRIAYVFYESGLSINVMYTVDDSGKRAVGFKLAEGMEVPSELASRFKFARQKSKLAGTIRGSLAGAPAQDRAVPAVMLPVVPSAT